MAQDLSSRCLLFACFEQLGKLFSRVLWALQSPTEIHEILAIPKIILCSSDGAIRSKRIYRVFGRCQRVPVLDIYQYEVSPGALQHLRTTLQKLSRTGFTWQDDYTQHVMAQELSSLPRTYLQHPEASLREGTSKPSVDNERRYSLENDVTLAKTLQQYLPYLGVLSQATASNVYPRTKNDKPPIKSDDPFPESMLTYMAQASKGSSSALTYPPMSWANYPEDISLRTLGPLQPDELSPKVDSGLDRQNLIAALSAYAAQRPAAPNLDKGTAHRSGILAPPVPRTDRYESAPEEDDLGMLYLLRAHLRALKPITTPTAQQKWPPGLEDPKEPLSEGDEAFIQNLLKELRKHPITVDNLGVLELDEVANVIANAMKGGDAEEDQESHGRESNGKPREQANSSEAAFYENDKKDNRVEEDDDTIYEKAKHLNVKFGNLLKEFKPQHLPEAVPLAKSFKMDIKKSEDLASSEEDSVGVENVKSQTFFKDLFDKKPNSEPSVDGLGDYQTWIPGALKQHESLQAGSQQHTSIGLQLEVKSSDDEEYGYIVTENDPLSLRKGKELIEDLAHLLKVPISAFADISVLGPAVTFKVNPNTQNVTTADVAKAAVDNKDKLEETSGLKILQTGIGSKSKLKLLPHQIEQEDSTKFVVLTLLSITCIVGVLLASGIIYCLRHSSHYKLKEKLSGLGGDPGSDATAAYQELCRQRMAVRSSERPEPLHTSRINSVSSQFSDGPIPSPSARSSTSSWSEEPVQSNMDISTGHMILSYMEDHLKNKNRLEKEWEALCAYQAEPNSSVVAQREENMQKNRCLAVLTYDHSRILLKSENSHSKSDYINASPIMDHDPRNPAYIATQGPLPATVADFWQMVWESGCVVIVMLTPLTENGVKQCYHYWPDEGSNLYHIYEVNLVSEHIWCEDFLVRSFYLKNLQTNETRTVTQFHFLSWYDQGVPSSTRSLLDFRRKVNKCYRGRSCPIIVHCSDGAGRSGTYVLIDMVLNKMAKGAKEIDIAATLEHLRDQRPGMVQTKEQFEFVLTTVAEEVNAILKALPQ
ncbi:PREDICTED: receptor-type tyrosine-protein phosphatase N2-like [Chrysochloris asiatica]|uniref:Receptor-type tyrosine-protein phosphatase N2-like n=1 Tax=Chrysochloris asiatica TaxID=185453 RepID=A0A9B0U249_CHRAS|nr:PREDICTED: receptor-type tyrosine-protein phosphatase N2-like [Chrysochloris asiatica]